jgi:RNA polymerase sigma factor (sigma-70 family)
MPPSVQISTPRPSRESLIKRLRIPKARQKELLAIMREHSAVAPVASQVQPVALSSDDYQTLASGLMDKALSGGVPTVAGMEDLQLVRRCMDGDSSAWAELIRTNHRLVFGICCRFAGDPAEAEDLVQDVFLKIFSNLANFDAERGSLQVWITTMTRSLLVNNFGRAKAAATETELKITVADLWLHTLLTRDGSELTSPLADKLKIVQELARKLLLTEKESSKTA